MLKLELCAEALAGIPAEITLKNKGQLLSQYWANDITYRDHTYDSAIYIDDNAAELLAAPNRPEIALYQIARPGQRYPKSDDPRITTVETLTAISVQA